VIQTENNSDKDVFNGESTNPRGRSFLPS
jgi:hypothetical protein